MDSEAPRDTWHSFRSRASFSSLSLSGQVPPPLPPAPTVQTWMFSTPFPQCFLMDHSTPLLKQPFYCRADSPWVCVWRSCWSCTAGTQRKVPPLALPAQVIVIPAPAPACCGVKWPALKRECDFITEIMLVYFCRCPWDLNLKRVLSIIVIKATKHVLGADTKEEFSKHGKALK